MKQSQNLFCAKTLYLFVFIGILAVVFMICGCAGPKPQVKPAVTRDSRITEEDVVEDRRTQQQLPADQEQMNQPLPEIGSEPQTQSEAPIVNEPPQRQPRRIIWRDKKGSTKNWRLDNSEGKEQ